MIINTNGVNVDTQKTNEEILELVANNSETITELVHTNGGAKIKSGSYTGGGKAGESTPNSLTFDFVPKLIIFWGKYRNSNNGSFTGPIHMFVESGKYEVYQDGSNVYTKGVVSVSGTTVSWYTTLISTSSSYTKYNPYGQLDYSGETYYYVAIG